MMRRSPYPATRAASIGCDHLFHLHNLGDFLLYDLGRTLHNDGLFHDLRDDFRDDNGFLSPKVEK